MRTEASRVGAELIRIETEAIGPGIDDIRVGTEAIARIESSPNA